MIDSTYDDEEKSQKKRGKSVFLNVLAISYLRMYCNIILVNNVTI